MEISVIPTVDEVISEDLHHRTVIVIDVLRATSTITTALAHECAEVTAVETVGQAKALGQGYLYGGERYCRKIPGFDYGNSPEEYMNASIRGQKLVMTTTNGTKSIAKAVRGSHVLLASLLNASHCAGIALSLKHDTVIICSGTRSEFALEDGLAAGALIDMMQAGQAKTEVNDFGEAMHLAFLSCRHDLEAALMNTASGRQLKQLGLGRDVSFCAQLDKYALTPHVKQQKITPYRT